MDSLTLTTPRTTLTIHASAWKKKRERVSTFITFVKESHISSAGKVQ